MGGGLESRCVGRLYGADGARHSNGCIENRTLELGNFIDVFLARHVSGTYAHHQEH